MSINVVIVSGNIGRDPELKTTAAGTDILSFSMAVNDRVRNSSGEWVDHTNWVNVSMFGARATALSRILTKGMRITVHGKLRYNSWERDGEKRSSIEITANEVDFLSRKESHDTRHDGWDDPDTKPRATQPRQDAYDGDPDDVPF